MATCSDIIKWSKNPRLAFVESLKPPCAFVPAGAGRTMFEHEAREYISYLKNRLSEFDEKEKAGRV